MIGAGGKRTISQDDYQKDVVYKEESSKKEPITSKITMPQISGVIVVCDGANNSKVNSNIVAAVEAVTGVPSHKVQVLERRSY